MNKTPNPATISPNVLSFLFFDNSGIAPTKAKKAKNGVKLNEDSEIIKVVIVVPILAPIMQAQAWNRVMVPKSANLTNVTEVTSEDCTTAECNIPVNTPLTLFEEAKPLTKNEFSLSVAFTKPRDIRLTPTKKHPHDVKTRIMLVNVFRKVPVANVFSAAKIISYYFSDLSSFFASLNASATTCAPVIKSVKSLGINTLLAEPSETLPNVS